MRRRSEWALFALVGGSLVWPLALVYAQSKGNEVFTPFVGSFGQVIPLAVPAFRGLEPRLFP